MRLHIPLLALLGATSCAERPPEVPAVVNVAPLEESSRIFAPQSVLPLPTVQIAAPASPIQSSPIEVGQTWVGQYTCAQGLTELKLQIQRVEGLEVDVLFQFEHVPTRAAGDYTLTGLYDPATRRLVLAPRAWISQPQGYEMVGLDGRFSANYAHLSGRITNDRCATFEAQRR